MSGLTRGWTKHLTPPHPGWQRTDPLDRGLIGEWRFDPVTGLVVPDYSGFGLSGAVQSDPQWKTGWFGSCLDFDGSNDYVDCGTRILWDSTKPGTIELLVNVDGYGVDIYPNPINLSSDQATGFKIFLSATANYTGINFGSSSNFVRLKSAGDISASLVDTWSHIILTYDGVSRTATSSYQLYWQAALLSTVDSGAFAVTTNNNYIGRASSFFDGKIALARIYGRALAPAEVCARYEICLKRAAPMTSVWMIPWGRSPVEARIPRPPAAYNTLAVY